MREGRELPAEGDNPPDDLIGGFDDNEFLAVRQADDGVGGDFDVLYQVCVQHKRDTINASEADHGEETEIESEDLSANVGLT